MRRRDACVRPRVRTRPRAAVVLVALLLISQCDATTAPWRKQQVALEPTLAAWAETFLRCAALGRTLAPHELAAQAAADGLLGPINTTQHRCKRKESDATVLWVDAGDGGSRMNRGGPWRPGGDLCQGLVFNHTSRQAHLTGERCDQLHCFLCSTPQDSSNCNMTGQRRRRCDRLQQAADDVHCLSV
jgi:hypothetical protein